MGDFEKFAAAGAGSGFSSADYNTEVSDHAPDALDIWGAAIQEGGKYSLGRSLDQRAQVELGVGSGPKLSIDEANRQYGLNLKPSFAKDISTSLAEDLARKKERDEFNTLVLQAGHAGMLEQLGGGLIASFTDPIELPLGLFMPWGKLGTAAEVSARAGELMTISTAERWAARTGTGLVMHNPFVAGAVENAAFQGTVSPLLYLNSQAMGDKIYSVEDAFRDVALAGITGGVLHTGSTLLRGKMAGEAKALPQEAFLEPQFEPHVALKKAETDFANGERVNVDTAVPKNQVLKDLEAAKTELVQKHTALDMNPDAEVSLESPQLQKHMTPVERRLLAVTDHETFKAEVGDIAERVTRAIAKLSDLTNLPKHEFVASLSDANLIQASIVEDLHTLNLLVPQEKALKIDSSVSINGVFTKRSLTTLGKQIGDLNGIVTGGLDDAEKVRLISAEHEKLAADLKRANQNLAQARSKGTSTETHWAGKVEELTPQLQHTQRLLQAMGKDAPTPELSLQTYLDGLGEDVPQALRDFVTKDPGQLTNPMYRVKKQIFDNIMSRMHNTQEYLNSIDFGKPPAKFPENEKIFREVKQYLDSPDVAPTVDGVHEALTQALEKNISDMKALGIFDQASLNRFDKIEEMFKENVEKTKAFKDGALQAQICALRVID